MSTLFQQGNKKGAKLDQQRVLDIRRLARQGMTQGALARLHGVSVITIGRIVRREVWQDVVEQPWTEEELAEKSAAFHLKMQQQLNAAAASSPAGEMSTLKNAIRKGELDE